ncbi:zinc ribbon domain-containing protein [Methylobacterium sp. WSM2598]|uniref:zinc ribbon domain-containing protein n=1 Tax=Methylobacterium sp. WSM2598 TaxID=398261 RepID=UPI003FA61495
MRNLQEVKQRKLEERDSKSCPRCAERIKRAATVCRYCGHELNDRDFALAASPITSTSFQSEDGYISVPNDNYLAFILMAAAILVVSVIGLSLLRNQ